MKTLLVVLGSLLLSYSVFADASATIYSGSGSGKSTASSCVFVGFTLIGFTGSIGGASFSNASVSIPVYSGAQAGALRLNAISYTVTSGTLVITEVK